jgi:tetratricopeptide (TPR) repeat protein
MLDLCNTLVENEEFDEAGELLNRLIRIKADWSEPYYSLAKVCFLKGNIEEGIVMIERAFQLSPEDRFTYDFEKDWRKILHFLITRQ